MKDRDVRFSQRTRAALNGYALRFNKVAFDNPQEGKANIVKREDEMVEGALYEIPESDMSKLHRAEGYPSHYGKMTVLVKLDGNKEVEALTYVAQPSMIQEGLKPTREYLGSGCSSHTRQRREEAFLSSFKRQIMKLC